MNMWRNILIFFVIGTAFFTSGFYVGKENQIIINPLEDIDFTIFNEVYHFIEKKHPEFENLTEEEVVYGAVEGMLRALGDDYTSFFSPERSILFMEDISGEFQGVGMEIGVRDGELRIISPLKNTPAYNAGIKAGDVITTVDGKEVANLTIEDAVLMIRGPEGTEVVLEIEREGEVKKISIIRDVINIPTVEWEIIEEDIAYIQIFSFYDSLKKDFSLIAKKISEEGKAKKIIIDLRGNPGGILDVAVDIASYFLEPGETVILTGKTKNESDEIIKKKTGIDAVLANYPVVIIIDQGSASASEILAGALKDQINAVIVGEKSFGKGSVQSMQSLSDGSVLKITERYFFTPNKSIINEVGISPDIEILLTEKDIEEGRDPQLQAAVKVLN
ncbi:MAG: S41 family peptidase [Patescibacteria group bacterium]|nr:S41 family peptidase [Patescibacteria group bacterium]